MKAVAKLKGYAMSARKMRLVADIIRGKNVDEALNVLQYSKKEASQIIAKTLLSAIANWEYKNDMVVNADEYDLVISAIMVDAGAMLKRFRPAPHGRAHRIRKHTCHITIEVENRILLDKELEGGNSDEEEYDEDVELVEEVEEIVEE